MCLSYAMAVMSFMLYWCIYCYFTINYLLWMLRRRSIISYIVHLLRTRHTYILMFSGTFVNYKCTLSYLKQTKQKNNSYLCSSPLHQCYLRTIYAWVLHCFNLVVLKQLLWTRHRENRNVSTPKIQIYV